MNFRTNRERGAINPKARNKNTELKTSDATKDKTKRPIISGNYFLRFIKRIKFIYRPPSFFWH